MKCVIHYGSDFKKAIRNFQDKRAALMMNRLSAYADYQLKLMRQAMELQAG